MQTHLTYQNITQSLDDANADPPTRRSLVVAMQRLSKKTNLYPKFFSLEDGDITEIGRDPVAAGSFADIYKARFKNQLVSLKVIRVFEASGVEYVVKVCHFFHVRLEVIT